MRDDGWKQPWEYTEAFKDTIMNCTVDMDNDPECPHCKRVFKRVTFRCKGIPTDGWLSTDVPVRLSPCGHHIEPWKLGLSQLVFRVPQGRQR